MVNPVSLGIFSDFFHWFAQVVDNFVHTLVNELTGLVALVRFIFSGFSLISQVTAVLPAIFGAIVALSASALIIKFVLGR